MKTEDYTGYFPPPKLAADLGNGRSVIKLSVIVLLGLEQLRQALGHWWSL